MVDVRPAIIVDGPGEEVFEFVNDARNDRLLEARVETCVQTGSDVGQQREATMRAFGPRYQGLTESPEFEPKPTVDSKRVEKHPHRDHSLLASGILIVNTRSGQHGWWTVSYMRVASSQRSSVPLPRPRAR